MLPLKFWRPETFEISTFKYSLQFRKNKVYNASGNDKTMRCSYRYNELGYRGDSIYNDGYKIMSIGCSCTEGVGVNDYETWPSVFTSLVPNGVNLNFGTGGRSNDFMARTILTYFDMINPDLVLILYTDKNRREYYTRENGVEPFMPTVVWGYMEETELGQKTQKNLKQIINDNEDDINWYKNHLLIKYFLESKKCKWIWNGSQAMVDYNDENRFDFNYNEYLDLGVDDRHPGPIHQKNYAQKLYEFAIQKYPDIPQDLHIIKELRTKKKLEKLL